MSNRNSILRWALPPGVSIAIHATLVILLIVVGSRAASLATQQPKTTHIPLAELEYTPPPTQSTPDQPKDQTQRADQPARDRAPSTLDQNARALAAPTPVATQAMSAATLEELTKQSTALSSEPSSAPAPISFAGVQTGAARSIVYVIDTSGSTLTSLTYIRERLLQSIDRLSPTQRFQVIAFRKLEDSSYTTPDLQTKRNKLPRATRANKQVVADWLENMPARGQSNPVDGLEAALDLNPDMILLIARGIQRTEVSWAGGLKEVRQRLDALNPINTKTTRRPVVIKTIQLLDEDPTGIMRTIGVFHGDGHNDHQVITYNQLVSPDPEPQTPPPSNTDARLTTAEDQLAALKAAGTYYRATTSIPTQADTDAITTALPRINAMLTSAANDDPRAALLFAETHLLSPTTGIDLPSLIEALDDTVFVSPDLDARRRITLAQLTNNPTDLITLLDERDQLNYSPITAAHAILILASHNQSNSQLTNQPPFTTDPAWALMLAETQALFNLNHETQHPLAPLLNLRANLPPLAPQIDASIVRLVAATSTDPTTLPDLPRFIIAKANISAGDHDQRLEAINTLLALSDSNDQSLAQESLWLACLGSRALNTRDANKSLTLAAAKLAQRFPDHPGAPDALAGAIDSAAQSKSPSLTPLLRQAIAQYPSRIEIDLWRLQLINLTAGSEQTALIQSLTPATRESDLGAEIYHTNARNAAPSDPLTHAIQTANTLDHLRSPLANHWHRAAAELEVTTDPISATIRLSRLVHKNINTKNPELELLYARALINADQPDQALARLTTLAASLNDNHNSSQSSHFWHAWTLILETIINQGTQPDKQAARAHLTRLSLIDPNLGPEPYRSRLIKAQNTLHSQP